MTRSPDDVVTITFLENNDIKIANRDPNRGRHHRHFADFDAAQEFFHRIVGAYYLDGYR
jgi:hypothetical protein